MCASIRTVVQGADSRWSVHACTTEGKKKKENQGDEKRERAEEQMSAEERERE